MNDIAILHKAVNNNSNAGSAGMVFEGVMTGEDHTSHISLVNEDDALIIVDAIKKGIYCSLHVTHTDIETNVKVEFYVGPIVYSRIEAGDTSNFALACLVEGEFVSFYQSESDPFVPNPSPEAPFEDPVS